VGGPQETRLERTKDQPEASKAFLEAIAMAKRLCIEPAPRRASGAPCAEVSDELNGGGGAPQRPCGWPKKQRRSSRSPTTDRLSEPGVTMYNARARGLQTNALGVESARPICAISAAFLISG